MIRLPRVATLPLLLALLLAGCQGMPTHPAPSASAPAHEPSAPAPASTGEPATVAPRSDLSEEIIFQALTGELAVERQQFALAAPHLYRSAHLANDWVAAERAMKVAMLAGDLELAQRAGKLWAELAPQDPSARQLLVILNLRLEEESAALPHLIELVALADAAEEGQDGFMQAMSAVLQDRNYAQAERLLQQLADHYPERVEGEYVLALVAMMQQQYAVAAERVEWVLAHAPEMAQAFALLARIRIAQEQQAEALEVLAKGVNRLPENAMLRTAYARLLLESGEVEAAYRQYQRLLELAGEGGYETRFTLGTLALRLDWREQAVEWFEGLYQDNHKRGESAFYLGWIAEEAGEVEQALGWYRRVRSGQVRNDAFLRMAGMVAAEDLASARQMLRQLRLDADSLEEERRNWLIEGSLVARYGSDPEEVYRHYDEALEHLKDDPELLYARAMFAVERDELDILERDLRRILANDPDHANALNALGYTLADRTDRYQEAYRYIARALELLPDSAAVKDSMGWVYFRLGELEQAEHYLREAFAKKRDAEIAAHLGELLWITGREEEALEVWQVGAEADPESDYLRNTLERLQVELPVD